MVVVMSTAPATRSRPSAPDAERAGQEASPKDAGALTGDTPGRAWFGETIDALAGMPDASMSAIARSPTCAVRLRRSTRPIAAKVGWSGAATASRGGCTARARANRGRELHRSPEPTAGFPDGARDLEQAGCALGVRERGQHAGEHA